MPPNTQKQRHTVNAYADLLLVNQTPGGKERTSLSRVSQAQLAAIKDGHEAVQRLKDLTKGMQEQVEAAEALVITAVSEGRPVTSGLLTPTVDIKTKYGRVSWKDAAEDLAVDAGLDFGDVEAGLKAIASERNTTYMALTLS